MNFSWRASNWNWFNLKILFFLRIDRVPYVLQTMDRICSRLATVHNDFYVLNLTSTLGTIPSLFNLLQRLMLRKSCSIKTTWCNTSGVQYFVCKETLDRTTMVFWTQPVSQSWTISWEIIRPVTLKRSLDALWYISSACKSPSTLVKWKAMFAFFILKITLLDWCIGMWKLISRCRVNSTVCIWACLSLGWGRWLKKYFDLKTLHNLYSRIYAQKPTE